MNEVTNEISLEEIFGIFKRNILLILLVTILFGGAAAGYLYFFAQDVYTSEATLYVLQTYQDSSDQLRVDTSASTSIAADYKELIKTIDIQEETAHSVGLAGVEELNEKVSIDIVAVSGTRVLNIVVKGEDKQLCTNVANVISKVFVDMVSEKTNMESLTIIADARVPSSPSGPPRIRYTLLAALVGALITFIALLMRNLLNSRIVTEKQVESILAEPILANVIDYRTEINKYFNATGNKYNNLLQSVSQQTQESIRVLATNIQFAETTHPLRSIAITSATPSEGKSSISVLTSQVMAADSLRVLIVDMDFKNPSIGRILKKRHTFDLIDYLADKAELDKVIAATHIHNLFFIDSHHKNISLSRVVKSQKFDLFLNRVRNMFDLVIFDTPPLGMFIDAAVLTSKLDGAVVVIAKNQVKASLAKTVVDQVNKGGQKTIGVVLNYAKMSDTDYKHYHYYYGGSE